jgi:hypothetical protein
MYNIDEVEQFSLMQEELKEGFKEGWGWNPPRIDWDRIRRDMENAARAAREWAERTAREARERAERLARETADRIARETWERARREAEARAAAIRAEQERQRIQREEDERRRRLALEQQIAQLSQQLAGYRGVENDYAKKKSEYDFLVKEYTEMKSKYELSLTQGDNLRANANTADETSIVANEDKQSISVALTKLYMDSTKKPIDIYNEILQQNRILDEKFQHLKDSFTTDDQKVFYENQQYDYLTNVKNILFIFYYALVVILVFILFISNRNDNVSKIWKAVIILLFIVYPYAIGIIETTVYTTFLFMYAMLNGDAYIANG